MSFNHIPTIISLKTLIVRYHVWVAIEEQKWEILKRRQKGLKLPQN